MTKQTIITENRITTLEVCVQDIKKDISDINLNLNNHVNDLHTKIDSIITSMHERPTWLFSMIVSILLMALGILAGHFLIH